MILEKHENELHFSDHEQPSIMLRLHELYPYVFQFT